MGHFILYLESLDPGDARVSAALRQALRSAPPTDLLR